MAKNIYENLSQLGANGELPASPSEATLEAVPNPHQKTIYLVRFTAPEFTSLCPVTGQADFAHFVIDYVPEKLIVESKSLKLFLSSFRNRQISKRRRKDSLGQNRARRYCERVYFHFKYRTQDYPKIGRRRAFQKIVQSKGTKY